MNKPKAVIIGTGRSGRGMLGELYDKAGFDITFADINSELVEGLRKQNWYTVQMTDLSTNDKQERTIRNFNVVDVNKDHKAYIRALAEADVISMALMREAFENSVDCIIEAIDYRIETDDNRTMFVTLGANYVGLLECYEKLFDKKLNERQREFYDKNVKLVMSIVNRKNMLPSEEEKTDDPYRVVGDNKPVLRVEDIEELRNAPFLPDFFRLEKDLSRAETIKIWTGNVVQGCLAAVALQHGCTNSREAAYNTTAARHAYYAAKEAYSGMQKEYGLPERSIEKTKETVTGFRNPEFADSLYRIAREPIRKFARNERFVGPALLCLKYGIIPYYIARSAAHAFLYYNENDSQCIEMKKHIAEVGIEKTIEEYCELDLSDTNDNMLYQLILNAYYDITQKNPIDE